MPTVFSIPCIKPVDVEELIDLTVEGKPDSDSMATMQYEGVAALYNILCSERVAYLADEVGTGKTYQALSLVALIWNLRPKARVLFVSPRQNLQEKWIGDYERFFRSNYRRQQGLGDDRAASVLFRKPTHAPEQFETLRSWTPIIGLPEPIAPFLRHTSFTRPVFLTESDRSKGMDELWEETRNRIRSWGIYEIDDIECPSHLSPDNASRKLNVAFAKALNRKLAQESYDSRHYFDLVIIDEAQCLRRPDNQTNQVLYEVLRGQVDKWLFMSATPAHGSPGDIPTILNRYPDAGELISPELAKHDRLPEMQEKLQKVMVRRQRRYVTTGGTQQVSNTVGKDEYRDHDSQEKWQIEHEQMTPLRTLAMGLVQKNLVDVLQAKNNRYRIGFLSSFESLQSSVRHAEDSAEWWRHEPGSVNDRDAPDARFIEELSGDFKARFGMPLPHAKVESVADQVATDAFGTDCKAGGQKYLVFTRRVSTVGALCDRLARRHRKVLERRIRLYWKNRLDWEGFSVPADDKIGGDDVEAHEFGSGDDPLRRVMAKGGKLFRYRQTFRASGRNALFFEDGWLQRLCKTGGVSPESAARRLPDSLWKESWTHASEPAGTSGHFRARRMRWLALHGVVRHPEVFGLSKADADPWGTAYEACLHDHAAPANPASEPHYDYDLFNWPTLWTEWDERSADARLGLCRLPAADPRDVKKAECLCHRQVARTILGTLFRLSDTLVDLYFADEDIAEDRNYRPQNLATRFLDWLCDDEAGAQLLRKDCEHWCTHLRMIVDNCLDGKGEPWRELARKEVWRPLFNLTPVVGVTGGSGGHRSATRQFRTPSWPRVLVCTDTLKEGVDLHLFCDRILHYGVAWTSGDMEQRVGRVDRYFSQIERRLREDRPPNASLRIGYPHVAASLERSQVQRVIARQKLAEKLMDSPLAEAGGEQRELVAGGSASRQTARNVEPFGRPIFPEGRRRIVAVSTEDANKIKQHYDEWYAKLVVRLYENGWSSAGLNEGLELHPTISKYKRSHELEWSFDSALERYVITISESPWKGHPSFSAGLRWSSNSDRMRRPQSFMRLLVPTPDEHIDKCAIDSVLNALDGELPKPSTNAYKFWGDALETLAGESLCWVSSHETTLSVWRGNRKHRVEVCAYQGSVRIIGVVASLDALGPRLEWGERPTPERVHEWALEATERIPLGFLQVQNRRRLVFGIHTLHGNLSAEARRRIVQEAAWRADLWEAALTGDDHE